MDTKPNLQKDNIKEQDFFTPEGYIRPNACAGPDRQTNLDAHPTADAIPVPAAHTGASAAMVVKSEQGGSTIVDFDYDKYADVERKATHTNAIAGLTLGILSLVAVWFSGLIAIVLSIVGIIFSLMGRAEPGGKSMATGGLVCSIIGLSLSLLSIIWTLFFIGSVIGEVISI